MNSAGTSPGSGADRGLTVTLTTFKQGPLHCAKVRADTAHGPILFIAAVDERHVARAMALARQLARYLPPDTALRQAYNAIATVAPKASYERAPKLAFASVPSAPASDAARGLAVRELVEKVAAAPERLGVESAVVAGATAAVAEKLHVLDRSYRGDPRAQKVLVGLARVAQSPTPAGRAAAQSLLHANRLYQQGTTRIVPAHRWGTDIWRLLADRLRQRSQTRGDNFMGASEEVIMGATALDDLIGGTYVHPEASFHPTLGAEEQRDLLAFIGSLLCF